MACVPTCLGKRPTFIIMMLMTSSFFFVEIIVGYVTNSMALVADSFHMLSDIISLFVGYFALKYSRKTNASVLVANTFGFVRAEVLGALINAVFLIALCFSITVEALKRLVEPEGLKDPLLILAVGSVGLLINLIGMLLFHGHAGHGHSHGSHGHSHHSHGHSHDSNGDSYEQTEDNKHDHSKTTKELKKVPSNSLEFKNKELKDNPFCDDTYPRKSKYDDRTMVAIATQNENDNNITIQMSVEASLGDTSGTFPEQDKGAASKQKISAAGQMNMKGVYLHILGDALGSVIVIIAALIVHFVDDKWTLYVDPVLSLVMVLIISKTTIPLLKESSLILLQNVPSHIQLQNLEERLLGEFPEIVAIHDFHVWQLTGNKIVASLHAKFGSNANYKLLSTSLKEFFHDEGIHSTTVQPEFIEDDSDDERECLLRCNSKTCEEKLCCAIENSFVEIINNEQADEVPIHINIPQESVNNKALSRSVELLSVTILDDNKQDKM